MILKEQEEKNIDTNNVVKQPHIVSKGIDFANCDNKDTWRSFFCDFAFIFRNVQLRKETIILSLFSIINTLCAYLLGDFVVKGSVAGVITTTLSVFLLTFLSTIQLRRIMSEAFHLFDRIPFAFLLSLLVMVIVANNLISAIILFTISSLTTDLNFMGGGLISMIFIVATYCIYGYWIFLWKRFKRGKKSE